jgi:hypothetical protein
MDDRTVVALFARIEDARRGVHAVRALGLADGQVSLLVRDDRARAATGDAAGALDPAGRPAAGITPAGVTAAGVTAAGVTAIGVTAAGVSTPTLPGIGPVAAQGSLGVAAAELGGLVSALVAEGIPEADAHVYAEGVRRGGSLLAVRTAVGTAGKVSAVLDHHGPGDIERHAAEYHAAGWTRFDEAAGPYGAVQISADGIGTEAVGPLSGAAAEMRALESADAGLGAARPLAYRSRTYVRAPGRA